MGKKYVLFVDETGRADINLDEQFSLAGVICEYKYSVNSENESELTKKLNEYKNEIFGREDLNIHLLDIINGKKEYKNIHRSKRRKFISELHTIFKDIECTIISITVNKENLKAYYTPNKDPYIIAFSQLLQCYYSFIMNNKVDSAKIVIEGIEDKKDLHVQKAFFDVFNNGDAYLKINEQIQEKITGFIVAKKGDCKYKSGLELVDIICNPLCRVKSGKSEIYKKMFADYDRDYGQENKIFNAVKNKIYTKTSVDDISNWGFKEIPIINNEELIKSKQGLVKEIIEKNQLIESLENKLKEISENEQEQELSK